MASGIVGGGGTLSDVYSSARRILLKAPDGIERLERFAMDFPDLASSVKRDITEVQSLCSNMDSLWRSIHVKSQRDLWRRFFIQSKFQFFSKFWNSNHTLKALQPAVNNYHVMLEVEKSSEQNLPYVLMVAL